LWEKKRRISGGKGEKWKESSVKKKREFAKEMTAFLPLKTPPESVDQGRVQSLFWRKKKRKSKSESGGRGKKPQSDGSCGIELEKES